MYRNGREPSIRGRTLPVGSQHRRAQSLTRTSKDVDENLDLFSKNRLSLSVASSDESSDVSVKLGRLSVGSVKVAGIGIDDLLSSTDGGKHDYDWLLTPPRTPLFPSADGSDSQPTSLAPRSGSLVRSTSPAKASRFSVSQSESNYSSRPARSSSVTRSSVCTPQYSTYSSSNRSSSILNTSSASVTSYTRPSSPVSRSPSTARPSTPSSRTTPSRSSTPSRVRPSPTSSASDRTRPSQSSRPSTPSSRQQMPANFGSPAVRSNSRPSTPTRRNPIPSLSSAAGPLTAGVRDQSNGRNNAPVSRPSSPGPRVRPPPQPIVPPDFPLDTPPNLRTSLPDRPLSAGRSRPVAVTAKGNSESPTAVNTNRRPSSPVIARGRSADTPGRGLINAYGHHTDVPDPRKASRAPELGTRKPVKTLTTNTESNGFGRTISKKSLDMAIRHMDIRNGTGGIRQLSGTALFPQSIRSAASKIESVHASSTLPSVNLNGDLHTTNNGAVLEHGNHFHRPMENGTKTNNGRLSAKLSDVDIYESSRYDAIWLKEDLKNTNWLRSIDDKTDTEPVFDNGFESLPEPFGLL